MKNTLFLSTATALFLCALLLSACASGGDVPDSESAVVLAPQAVEAIPLSTPSPTPLPTPQPSATPLATPSPTPMKILETPASVLVPAPPRETYNSVHVQGKYIALTFDDGPHKTLTPKLLDILASRGVKVTFFVVGQNVEMYPEIVQRAMREGHEIASHTWSHPQLTKLSKEAVHSQLERTDAAIVKATGVRPRLLRPPYGAFNQNIVNWMKNDFGYKNILWSVDPNDWKRPGSSVVAQRILAGTKPGAIILSHDIHPGTIEAVPTVLDSLLAQGYKFVTVSELIGMDMVPQPSVPNTNQQ